MSKEVKCPKCKSPGWVRKGKTKDKRFQKLMCKNCGKRYQVEEFLVNKQEALPLFENRIVEHSDGTFSVDRVKMLDKGIGESIEQISIRKDSFGELMTIIKELKIQVNPNVIRLRTKDPREQLFKLINQVYNPKIANLIRGYIKSTEAALKFTD